ncbi:MAG TPA: ectoine/hydroxyectoine ABC transporter substrate-binding protein EhuB [Burkholderiaceae bacterium]|nr:ectoine/hydroxyectoine ABC transporter substrate-binding protein EhuB [Burkholderiaceae bacterium]
MKKTYRTALLALSAASLALGIANQTNAETLKQIKDRGYIRIAVANEIPYGYIDPSGNAKGAGPDVATQVMKQLGVKEIQWVATNFGSLIPGLLANRFDMVAAEMAVLPPRCKKVIFSEPDSSYGEGLLVAKGNPDNLHSYEAFAKNGKKIAIMAGADQLEMLQALKVPAGQMVTISSNSDAISTVATGRAAAYAATSLTASQLAAKSQKVEVAKNFKDPVVDGKPVRSWGAFVFSKKSTGLRDAVNKQLAKFKKTPAWSKIMTQYGFTEADNKASFEKTTSKLCSGG